jgi:hypothetical protein
MDKPAFVAKEKPDCKSLSANITVDLSPHFRKETLMSLEISFFFRTTFNCLNNNPGGKIRESRALPVVV